MSDRAVTVVLSGPLAGRQRMWKRLERAGLDLSEQPDAGKSPSHGLQAVETEGWITVLAPNLRAVEAVLEGKWRVRLHHRTPRCSVCRGQVLLPACSHCGGAQVTNRVPMIRDPFRELDELRRELAILKGGAR